jgi:hypothetical protein
MLVRSRMSSMIPRNALLVFITVDEDKNIDSQRRWSPSHRYQGLR